MTSTSRRRGLLRLRSDAPGVRLTVLAASGAAVTEAWDSLDMRVPPGVYEVVAQRLAETQQRVVLVGPGATRDETFSLPVPGSAAVPGTTDYDSAVHDAVRAASERLARMDGGESGLALVAVGADEASVAARAAKLAVTDPDGSGIRWGHRLSAGRTVARLARLAPGGYVLRSTHGVTGALQAVEQTLWLPRGWQVIVVVPVDEHGVQAHFASARLCALGEVWDGVGALGVEILLAQLRSGRPSLPPSLVEADPRDPMLALLAAHCVVGTGEVPRSLIEQLSNLLPDHPDVIALRAFAQVSSAGDGAPQAGTRTSFPPMLASAYYRCLLPADRADAGTLPADSLAEAVGGTALAGGPWLQWQARPRQRGLRLPAGTSMRLPHLGDRVGWQGISKPTAVLGRAWDAGGVLADVLGGLRSFPSSSSRPSYRILRPSRPSRSAKSEAAQRVESYVASIGRRRGTAATDVAHELGAAELGERLGMPTSLVERALREAGL